MKGKVSNVRIDSKKWALAELRGMINELVAGGEERRILLYQKWECAQLHDIVHKSSKALWNAEELAKCWNQLLWISCYIRAEKVIYMRSGHSFSTIYGDFSSPYLTLVPGKNKTWRVRFSIWSDIAFPAFLREKIKRNKVCHTAFINNLPFFTQVIYRWDLFIHVHCLTHTFTIPKHCLFYYYYLVYIMQWPRSSKRKKYFGDISKQSLDISGHCFSLYLWQCIC